MGETAAACYQCLEHYLILQKSVQLLTGELPLHFALDGQIHRLRFHFGLLGLRGLLVLLLLFAIFSRCLKIKTIEHF